MPDDGHGLIGGATVMAQMPTTDRWSTPDRLSSGQSIIRRGLSNPA
ncbi:MAG: hypothetical protein KYX64_06525 [Sphingopyxis sp.]|nr:hypothetical protein [Sphingopyxis sp.]